MSQMLNQLNQQLKDAKELVARRDLALKLNKSTDFRKLLNDFCVVEAARLVGQSADPVLSPEQRADALSMAQAGGHLNRYLSMMIRMGDMAEASIPEIEESIVELSTSEDVA